MVWPKFRIARRPLSVSSLPTTSALISQQRAMTSDKRFWFAFEQSGQIAFQPAEQCGVVDDAVFDDFGEAGAELARGQRSQRVEIAQDESRLIKRTDEIFAGFQVHAHFSADRTVHLRKQGGGYLHEGNAAQISGGHKAGEIADDSAAERHNERFAFQPMRGKLVVTGLNRFEALDGFAGGHNDKDRMETGFGEGAFGGVAESGGDVGIGNNGAILAEFESRSFGAQTGEQAGADFDVVRAAVQWNFDDAHGPRIKSGAAVSKKCLYGLAPGSRENFFYRVGVLGIVGS